MLINFKVRLNREQIAKVIYGSILILVVVLALEEEHFVGVKNSVLVLFTAFAIMLAELYSDVISSMIENKRNLSLEEWQQVVLNSGAVMVAAFLPALCFLLGGLAVIPHETSFQLAKWSAVLLLGLYGYLSTSLAGRSQAWRLTGAASAILIGLIIVSVKFLLEI